MRLERILFTTKFREFSYKALEALLVLRETGLKEIILCNIISREEVGFVPFGGYMKDEEEKLREEARIRFEDWRMSIEEAGIECSTIIKVGDVVPKILHAAEDAGADLIVVGRKSRISLEHPFAGSKTMQIVTRSRIPTLVSKYMLKYKAGEEVCERLNDRIFETPMLVTDWSEPSRRALNLLVSLKQITGRALVFNDVDARALERHGRGNIQTIEKEHSKKLESFCVQLKEAGIKAESHLGAGDVVEEIIRISRERQASIIIIGTSRKGRWSELIHGSISHRIATDSELPTLLVP